MSTEVEITWRECPRDRIKADRRYQPPEPYDSVIEVDFPNLFTGEDAAEALIRANVDEHPESWDRFDYIVEILTPEHLTGRYHVEIVMEPDVIANRIEEAA